MDPSPELTANYYDGHSSVRRTVRIFRDRDQLHVQGDGVDFCVSPDRLQIEPRLGGLPRNVAIPGFGQLEVADQAAFAAFFGDRDSSGLDAGVWLLERRWGIAAAALVATVAIILAFMQWGLPWAAREVALRMPAGAEQSLGEQTLRALDETMLSPSMVDGARVTRLRGQMAAMTARLGDGVQYRVEIRAAPQVGPNAFALPGGIIVFTDELVLLAQGDEELAAVLAHEIGHVRHRHSLRHAIQNSAATLIVALLTGDLLSASSWAAALPAATLQARYSREFEREADRFAVEMLRAQGIPPKNLASILHRISGQAAERGKEGISLPDWLSTHPSTEERAAAIEGR